ncbi:hypothetical protein ABG79_00933 [Caloramator mitchellensis]|uniref:PEGA domain-containing protein n=1 Tax=Caloramator mitchellensis TaxID=908809 RepID=A0A0R3K474_CALMK|nr:hypothetical protein [Caloramator mitchellensis]KRQ87135.1 hypothetical protein ABG79_00933 [Caloramator mitchellensis]
MGKSNDKDAKLGMTNNNVFQPLVFPFRDIGLSNTKIEHDNYEVYVDGEFIGEKVLITQNEKPEDITAYLTKEGYKDFQFQVEGNKIFINTINRELSEGMRSHLEVYLNIR